MENLTDHQRSRRSRRRSKRRRRTFTRKALSWQFIDTCHKCYDKEKSTNNQEKDKHLTSITFGTTDRFCFICIKPRRTWLWTSSDEQRTVKPNRTVITGHTSFRGIKSSATWYWGITLYSAPRADMMGATLK